jgi:hypothetical protein
MMAAGALLLGTSALAYDAGKGIDAKFKDKPAKIEAVGQSQQMKKAVLDVLSDAAVDARARPAGAAAWDAPAIPKVQPASAVVWDGPDSSVQLPSDTPDAVDTSKGDPNLDLTANPEAAPVTESADMSQYRGEGGPGPGDDRCIQLYEPGVRAELANWTQPTGGFIGQSTQTAMGGPYEPVGDESANSVGASDEVLAAADAEAPEFVYNGDGVISGPTDVEGTV